MKLPFRSALRSAAFQHHALRLLAFMFSSAGILRAETGIFASTSNFGRAVVDHVSFDGTSQTGFAFPPDPTAEFASSSGQLTTDGTHLYCAGYIHHRRMSLSTGVIENFATFEPGHYEAKAITTDGHRLIIGEMLPRRIVEYSMDFKFRRVIVPSIGYLSSMVTDGIHIYWADEDKGIFRVRMDGSGQEQILERRNVFGLSASSTHLYYRSNFGVQSITRCELDGSNEEMLVDLVAVFGAGNHHTSALTVGETHVYWGIVSSGVSGYYRCGLDGADPQRLTTFKLAGGNSLIAYPSALFPEPMAPVTPRLTHDPAAASVRLDWTARTDRRYRVSKSTDLRDFTSAYEAFVPTDAAASVVLESPEPSAFFVVEKLPGKTGP